MSDPYLQQRLVEGSVTIPNGETTSNAIKMQGKILVSIITPSALTGNTFKFKVSIDGTTYLDYYNPGGSIVNISAGANRHIGFIPADFAGIRYVKLVSSSAEGAERIIKIIMRGM